MPVNTSQHWFKPAVWASTRMELAWRYCIFYADDDSQDNN